MLRKEKEITINLKKSLEIPGKSQEIQTKSQGIQTKNKKTQDEEIDLH